MHRGTAETWPPLAIIATLLGHRDHDSVCPVPPEDRCGRMFMNARKETSQLWSSSLPYCCPTVPVLGGSLSGTWGIRWVRHPKHSPAVFKRAAWEEADSGESLAQSLPAIIV